MRPISKLLANGHIRAVIIIRVGLRIRVAANITHLRLPESKVGGRAGFGAIRHNFDRWLAFSDPCIFEWFRRVKLGAPTIASIRVKNYVNYPLPCESE